MPSPRPPYNPNQPVPNNPFAAETQWSVKGDQGGFIVGEGIEVNASDDTITATVRDVIINTANGISGGPITNEGTLTLTPSGVIPGTYGLHNLTIDIYGRVVDAAPGAPASTATAGPVRLSSFEEVAEGTDNTSAVTPAGLQSIKSSSVADPSQTRIATPYAVKVAYDKAAAAISSYQFTAKGQILASTGPSSYLALPLGSNGQVLKVCSSCPSGLTWGTDAAGNDIPCSIITGAGQLIVGTGASQFIALAPGTDGYQLVSCAACTGGLTWSSSAPVVIPEATPIALGTVYGCTSVNDNTAIGYCSSLSVTSGTSNVSVGTVAMCCNETGSCNVAVGYGALNVSTAASFNTGVGALSLLFATGDSNTAVGLGAGCSVSTGSLNTFVGNLAGKGISAGSNNLMLGTHPQMTDVSCNIVLGVANNIRLQINENGALSFNGTNFGTAGQVLQSNGNASPPVWVTQSGGVPSATPTTEGIVYGLTSSTNGNSGLGYQSLASVGAGVDNTSVGANALELMSTGSFNTAAGVLALGNATTGQGHVAIGHCAMVNANGGSVSVAIGANALAASQATGNIGIGENAVCSVGTCGCNVGVGHWALRNNTQPDNTAVGAFAANCNVSGNHVTALGFGALRSNIYSNANTALGRDALALHVGFSGNPWCCAENTAVGYRSVYNGNGHYNTAVGARALESNVTGSCQVAVGHCSLNASDTGIGNVAVGQMSLVNSVNDFNTAVGYHSGFNLVLGSNNVFVGNNSGADTLCSLNVGSNHVILGNNNTTCILQKVATTVGSDIRYKKVHGEVPLALPFVESLETIKYQWCDNETGEVTDDRYRYGFSAQNVIENEEDPEHPIIGSISNPDMLTLSPTDMIPVLVNAIKELSAKSAALQAQLDALTG